MKVYVTQGHERGIGLEVFFKTCLFLSKYELATLELIAFKEAVEKTLSSIKLPYEVENKFIEVAGQKINVSWCKKAEHSQSLTALNIGMKKAEEGGVLFTLPTSKDQFISSAGHTEYFRTFYNKPELGMFFSSPRLQVLLLSDHIPVVSISSILTTHVIEARLREALDTFRKWNWPIERILVSGFNPHSGEDGLIGNEDQRIKTVIKRLSLFSEIEISGPLPGDTMLLEQKSTRDLLVYVYHDQGLGVFKGLQGLIGSNITLGLPYPRVSPDHGTSFKLYGKNQADHRGCSYSTREAIFLLKRIQNGKNSGHQG